MSDPGHPIGPDWRNTIAYLGATLAFPVLAVIAAFLTDVMYGPGLALLQLLTVWMTWFFWMMIVPYGAWSRWQGRVDPATLRIGSHTVTGRTSLPLRRLRSVHLDQLWLVRYRRRFQPIQASVDVDDYIIVHDAMGGRIAVQFSPHFTGRRRAARGRLCRALRSALDSSPYAHATELTRRRLAGEHATLPKVLGIMLTVLLAFVAMIAAIWVTVLALSWVGIVDGFAARG